MKYSWRCHCRKKGGCWYNPNPDEVHFVHAKNCIQAKERFVKKFPDYELQYIDVPFVDRPFLPF